MRRCITGASPRSSQPVLLRADDTHPGAGRQALLLVGHGSLRAGSGSAMIRLAARAREADIASIVEAGFLNYSRPSFTDALGRIARRGASTVIVQPYFLVPGWFVRTAIPRLLPAAQRGYPGLRLLLAQPFGDHPALAQLVSKRAAEVDCQAAHSEPAALLIVAHGSPNAAWNQPVHHIGERLQHYRRYAAVSVCFLDLNQPSILEAIDTLVSQGMHKIIAVPYFLQLGSHVAEDLPQAIEEARQRYPSARILLAQHLAYDPLLVSVIADRAEDVRREKRNTRQER